MLPCPVIAAPQPGSARLAFAPTRSGWRTPLLPPIVHLFTPGPPGHGPLPRPAILTRSLQRPPASPLLATSHASLATSSVLTLPPLPPQSPLLPQPPLPPHHLAPPCANFATPVS